MISLKKKYEKEIVPEIKKKFNLSNNFEVPKIEKIVVNAGVGKFLKDSNVVEEISKALSDITGQKTVSTKAKQSIAGFKIREGLEVGMKVTLRGRRMWDFLEKLSNSALPRIRDFRGLKPSAIDESGNLNIGIKEHLIFPEILPEQVKNIFSLQVTITTNAKNKEKGAELFKSLGFPIEK